MNQLNITRLILLCEFEFNFSEFTVSTSPLSAGDSFQFQILKRRDKNKNVRGGIKEFLSDIFLGEGLTMFLLKKILCIVNFI